MKLADGLGVASIALGAPMLAAPTRLPGWIGIESDAKAAALTVLVGLRELAGAFTILGMRHRRIGAVARAAGDTMDLVLLGRAFASRRLSTPRLAAAIGAVAGIYAADLYAAIQLSRAEGVGVADGSASHGTGMTEHVETGGPTAVTICRAEAEVREAFGRYPWTALEASGAESRGEVRFLPAPGERGTEVHVSVTDRAAHTGQELRRFKALLETGVEPRSDKTPESHSPVRQILQRPGQPVGGGI